MRFFPVEQCDWLLNRDASNGSSAAVNGVRGLDQSLDTDSSMYKAIMSNHVIQLALVNPKTLTGMYVCLSSSERLEIFCY